MTESLRHKAYLKHEIVPGDDPDNEISTADDPGSMPTQQDCAVPGLVEPAAAKTSFDRTKLRKRAGRE